MPFVIWCHFCCKDSCNKIKIKGEDIYFCNRKKCLLRVIISQLEEGGKQ